MDIQAELNRAAAAADAYRKMEAVKAKQAMERYNVESHHRAQDNGLYQRLSRYDGRMDDTYTVELPLLLGWNAREDGTVVAFIALGGVDVTEYLPPDVLREIQDHVNCVWEDEQ